MRVSVFFLLSAPLAALAAPVTRAASANTMLVLKFAHVLELLETQFYTDALAKFQDADFTGAGFANAAVPKEQFNVIAGDEKTHADLLASTIVSQGGEPLTSCKFDFSSVLTDVKTMAATARLVENVGVSAYLGAAPLVDDLQLLGAAASILTSEARHQTMLNVLNGGSAVYNAFDMALKPDQVLSIAGGFISGCDLGIAASPSLGVSNTGTIAPGTKLELKSDAITGSTANLTCQMLTGGAPFAIALPFDNCVVPEGINGLVYVFVTNTTQPLLSNLANQFGGSIVAGPLGAFIDTQPETLSQMLLAGGSGGAAGGAVVSTSTISVDAASSLAAAATETGSATATATGSSASVTATQAASNAGGAGAGTGGPNLATGDINGIKVIGWKDAASLRRRENRVRRTGVRRV